MSTAATCRARDATVSYRGPRLSVRRRRLRGLRGAGRPAGRRAPPYGALVRSLGELRIALPMSLTALSVVLREMVAAQPRARRHRLSAGHARRRPARPCLSAARYRCRRGRDREQARPAARSRRWPPRASPSSPCRTIAGTGSTSNRSRCCPMCSPSRPRRSRARARPGSWTRTATSPKGPRPMPGSSRRDGKLVTRQADHSILRGITRTVVLDVLRGAGARARGAALHRRGGQGAREAFITSASQTVMPVVRIDGRPVGNGAPGLIATALRRDFHRFAEISDRLRRVGQGSRSQVGLARAWRGAI